MNFSSSEYGIEFAVLFFASKSFFLVRIAIASPLFYFENDVGGYDIPHKD